jgi:hypothetical protein
MAKHYLIFVLLLVIFMYGCQEIVCNPPYIQVGTECCLDQDNNKVCDKDEKVEEESKIVITEKKPEIIEKEVKVKEYVCSDGSIVDDTSKCPIDESKPLEEEPDYETPTLAADNEENTWIETVTVEPACPNAVNGGKIFFKVGTLPSEIKVEVKEVGKPYEAVFTRTGIYEQFQYFAICERCRGAQLDFKLKPDKLYVLRMMFNQTKAPKTGTDGIDYSNEHLIDTREDSDYMLKICN